MHICQLEGHDWLILDSIIQMLYVTCASMSLVPLFFCLFFAYYKSSLLLLRLIVGSWCVSSHLSCNSTFDLPYLSAPRPRSCRSSARQYLGSFCTSAAIFVELPYLSTPQWASIVACNMKPSSTRRRYCSLYDDLNVLKLTPAMCVCLVFPIHTSASSPLVFTHSSRLYEDRERKRVITMWLALEGEAAIMELI